MNYDINTIRNRYQMVPRTLIFIEKDQHILTIHKNNTKSFGYGKINGIGGHIEIGEEPYQAARREIMEETGLEVDNLELCSIVFIDINENPGIILFVFKAVYTEGELTESAEGSLHWMTRDEIQTDEKIVKDLPFLINLVDSHAPENKLRVINYRYLDTGELRIAESSYK